MLMWLENMLVMTLIFLNLLIFVFSFYSHSLAFQYNLLSGSERGGVSADKMLADICWVLIMWWEKFKWLMVK